MEQKTTVQRLYWMDAAKAAAILFVVMQHSISGAFTTLPTASWEWKLTNFIFELSRLTIPLFIMCSGIGMLSKERTVKRVWTGNIFAILKIYAAWMCVFGLISIGSLLAEGYTNPITLINAMLKSILFGHYHTWFIMMLAGLYMITPFLSRIAGDDKLLRYFTALSVIFTIFIPVVGRIDSLSRLDEVITQIDMKFAAGYSMYFMTGFFLSGRKNLKKYRWIILFIFIVTFLTAFFWSNSVSVQTGEPYQLIYTEFYPLGFILSICSLCLFKAFLGDCNKEKFIQKIAGIQKYGIAVYLMHPIFTAMIPEGAGAERIGYGIAIWILSLLIAIVISRIPILNRIFIKLN